MNIFYLIIFIVSALAFIADIILRYVEKIKNFTLDKKLFSIRGDADTIPIEKVLPANLTMLILAVMAGSAAGGLLDLSGVAWYLSLPCAVSSGLLICFTVQHLGENIVSIIKRNRLPKGEKAAGLNGYCVEFIGADGLGKAEFVHGGRKFEVAAASANESDIDPDDEVIAVYEENGFYFVTKINEIYKGIDTDF
jgi:hypothetical protein